MIRPLFLRWLALASRWHRRRAPRAAIVIIINGEDWRLTS